MTSKTFRECSKWLSQVSAAGSFSIVVFRRSKFICESENTAGRLVLAAMIAMLLTPIFGIGALPRWQGLSASAQQEENFPPLSYLRSDYRAVSVVAHVRMREAEITGRVGGYENWRIVSEVLESFKGRVRKGDVIEYFQGAEAGLKKESFKGEKIIFLLADYDGKKKTLRYSVLENSTLPSTADRLRKMRIIRRSDAKRRSTR